MGDATNGLPIFGSKKSSATQSLDAVRESTIKETEEVTLRRFPDDLLEILRGTQPTLNIRNPVPL